jgi:glycosyltransferase involved in cell wall biosynthesis
MKILFLALDVDLNGNHGDTVHVRELARAYRDKGCQVTLLAGNGESLEGLEGIQVHVLKKYFSWQLRFLDDFRAALVGIFQLGILGRRMIYERRFSCKVGLLIHLITRAPLLVEINGLVDDEAKAQEHKKNSKMSSGWSLRFADYIVAVAPGLANALIERYGIPREKIEVVSNGVNPDKFYPVSKEEARTRLRLDKGCNYLCFVGNIVAWYDFPTMIRALQVVRKRYPDIKLLIVGDGKKRQEVERLIHELGMDNSVTITGYVAHEKVPDYICASDICLAPFTRARNERIGLSPVKLFEYLGCGRPVISTFIGGLERYASEIPALHLVKPEDFEAFGNKIIELLYNPQEEANLRAAEIVRSKYAWSNTAEAILQLVNSK